MKQELLRSELDFVGKRKKIYWFNADLANKPWFQNFMFRLAGGNRSWRNIFYSLFPATEYVCKKIFPDMNPFSSLNVWKFVLDRAADDIVKISNTYGTQGNIPQRAAIFLDYIRRSDLFEPEINIVELGCSGALLGMALENYETLFRKNFRNSSERYFWLKRCPALPPIGTKINYIGVDLKIPPDDLLPFFVWDKEKREKIVNFQSDFTLEGQVVEADFRHFLESGGLLLFKGRTIIITSFFLYHFDNQDEICDLIKKYVSFYGQDIVWLDLSRNRQLKMLSEHQCRPDYIYLSHNGWPVARIINGSDDCPDWEYI